MFFHRPSAVRLLRTMVMLAVIGASVAATAKRPAAAIGKGAAPSSRIVTGQPPHSGSMDGQNRSSASLGPLTVTIVSPANGAVLVQNPPITIVVTWCDIGATQFRAHNVLLDGVFITSAMSPPRPAGCSLGGTTTVSVYPSYGTHTVTATGTDNLGGYGSATSTFTIQRPAPEPQIDLSPANGSSVLGPTMNIAASWCDPDDQLVTHDLRLDGQLLSNTYAPQSRTGCVAAGNSSWSDVAITSGGHTITATASDAAGHVTTATSNITVQLPPITDYQPEITPHDRTLEVPLGSSGSRLSFAVRNAGSRAARYQLATICSGTGVSCTVSPTELALAVGATDSARITYTTPSTVGSVLAVKLSATYRDADGVTIADTASVSATTAFAADLYQPRVATSLNAVSITPPGAVASFGFTVTNVGRATARYGVWAWGTSGVTFPDGTGMFDLGGLTLGPGESSVVWVNAKAPTVDGQTGRLWLFVDAESGVEGEPVSDGDYINVTALAAQRSVVVRPAAGSSQPLMNGVSPQWAAFHVTNVTSAERVYTLQATCTGVATACRYADVAGAGATQTTAIAAGEIRYVPVYFDVGAGANGSVQLLAYESAAMSARDSSTIVIGDTPAVGGVRINAVGASSARGTNESFTQDFYIVNTTASSAAFTFESGYNGTVFQSCERAFGTTPTLPANALDSAKVSVRCTTVPVSGQSGELFLVATMVGNDSVQARSSVHTTTALQTGLLLDVKSVNAGPSVAREQCLTVAVGDNAAYECSELRVVHSLPSTTTMGQTHTPMLVYRNHGPELIAADVTFSPLVVPDSIEAWITHAGTELPQLQHRTFRWIRQWSNGLPRRIVVPASIWDLGMNANGAYDYDFVLKVFAPESTFTVTEPGQLAVVNRVPSPFGFNWWLDGLEQLSFNTPRANQILWIGGDGSTRLFSRDSSRAIWFVTPTLDRIDSLTFDGSTYRRYLRNGAWVEFDAMGRHRTTVNSKGHRTTFAYDNPADGALLTSISLPVPSGGTPRVYTFAYGTTAGSPLHLTQVTAPGLPGFDRRVVIGDSVGDFNLPFIASITDPDRYATKFRYSSFALVGRRDKRDVETSFVFYWTMLRQAIINMEDAADNIVHTFCAAEWASYHPCAAGPIAKDSVFTSIDGPRSDVPDNTWFEVNRWGGPSKIENAAHDVTLIERADPRWPLLPTLLTQPNGHRVAASYTSRGLLDVVSDINPLGDGRVASTSYQWHPTFDKVELITGPTGEVTRFGYDANGDREWQEDGRGAMSRTTFTYYAARQLKAIRLPGKTDFETYRFEYDPLVGNLQAEITPLGAATRYDLDAIGRVETITSPANDEQERIQAFVYDSLDRVRIQRDIGPAVTHSRGTAPAVTLVVTTVYDREGNPRSVERRSDPNLAQGGSPRTEWTYDNAGRKLTQFDYSGRLQRWAYDPAGNVREWTTGRMSGGASVVVRTDYDTLNRPIRRTLPSVSRPAEVGAKRAPWLPELVCEHPARFPYFTPGFVYDPNVEAECDFGNSPLPPALVLLADVAVFTYDNLGNVKTANNNDARITRDYYPNGALKKETQAVAIFDESTPLEDRFTAHRYSLEYTYDLSGRRLSRTDVVPRCEGCVQTYRYEGLTGFLDEITDVAPAHPIARFGFQYDSAGRLAFHSVNDSRSTVEFHYDNDSRLDVREVRGNSAVVYRDILSYDRSARVIGTFSESDILASRTRTTSALYNGLGALAMFSHDPNGDLLEDEFITDGLGNRVSDRRWYQNKFTTRGYRYTLDRLGDVIPASPWQSGEEPPPQPLQVMDSVHTDFSATGSAEYSYSARSRFDVSYWKPEAIGSEWTWNVYGADERLRVTQRSTQTDQHPRTVFSEYRYDALGRRVAVRTRWDQNCQHTKPGDCLSATERTVWDGDQILAEIRSFIVSESDFDTGPFVGAVRYTHGAGLDEPLAIWKIDIGGVVPHRSWRGTYEAGTPIDESSSNVSWPGGTQDVFFAPDVRVNPVERTNWIGSLVEGKAEPSGLTYMRNRYYDAKTGRFTQEDPIGLAGGVNLYGFASADPVNFSDPFGLCPECIFDAVALALDVGEIREKGLSWGNGLTLAADVLAALTPFVPAGAGAARRALSGVGRAIDEAKPAVQVVERAMSRSELASTLETGLVRGGRAGTHYVSDAVNANAARARQRLALPKTPEFRVRMEVPNGSFSSPTRIRPAFGMPGGGLERTANGTIPARVIKVYPYEP